MHCCTHALHCWSNCSAMLTAQPTLLLLLGSGLGLFLQRGAKDVAQRSAAVGRAVLRNCLLFLGDLKRLDREIRLLRPIETGDEGIELLTDLETLRTLLVAVAAEVGALDEASGAAFGDLDVETA